MNIKTIKLVSLMLLLWLFPINATAEKVLITEGEKGQKFFTFSESFEVMADGWSTILMIVDTDGSEKFHQIGVTFGDCQKGHGDLLIKSPATETWNKSTTFNVHGDLVIDIIVKTMCDVGDVVVQRLKDQIRKDQKRIQI